ncbi:SCO family protein [Pullulanibacillus sp. KACC 23026]|uniref:SCO family protein n=1 Tax=Pullulanibacillus sp. KACC 23026 TaxID=3028315 RepID=UPI0023AFD219|nr:SCO family protein [Pullulanibacillus sp. KACC 23026]WEG13664.1 SCO family protein [Pullulanibacillus sp. KACC 23026]
MKKIIVLLFASMFMTLISGCGLNSPSTKASGSASQNKPDNVTDVSNANWKVKDFNFTDEHGQPYGLSDLKGKVWLADFYFTNCVSICPPMTANMVKLQEKLKKAGAAVQIVSFSVDPKDDTPDKLIPFSKKYGADLSNWHFLTGYSFDTIKDLSVNSFKSAIAQPEKGSNQYTHGTSYYLVNQNGQIVKFYHGFSDVPFNQIVKDVLALDKKGPSMAMGGDMSMPMDSSSPLKVTIQGKKFKARQKSLLTVKVTEKNKPVADAEEVMFEIWKKGDQKNSKMYKAKNKGNGLYSLSFTFKTNGIYEVTAHVTARGSHTMPTKEMTVRH